MSIPSDLETIAYEERGPVAWITLNRPEVYNAFNDTMMTELRAVYRAIRRRGEVRVVVLTGTGKAFCTGVDRNMIADTLADPPAADADDPVFEITPPSPFMYEDAGRYLGPKSCGLWKPVIAAVNGMACGGAFYFLGEVEFVIAAEDATFFDPHVSYGNTAAFEPILMLQKMPFNEIMRLSLMGNHERMSAKRAYEIGLVSEVVPAADLVERAQWAAEAIAASPAISVQGTVRALWAAQELSRAQALEMGYSFVTIGNQPDLVEAGQEAFGAGRRIDWRLR